MYYDMDYDLEAQYEDQWGDPERDFEEEAFNASILDDEDEDDYGFYGDEFFPEDVDSTFDDYGAPPF